MDASRSIAALPRSLVVGFAALALVSACAAEPPLRMNDFEASATQQGHWHLAKQMLFVVPVPAFNQPVHIRDVELKADEGVGTFDHPAAYLLSYAEGLFYGGPDLVYDIPPIDLVASTREPLSKLTVRKMDNSLSIVIPVNIHTPGCHQAQVVLHVRTSDGRLHTVAPRWYVSLDTSVTSGSGFTLCIPDSH